MEPITLSEAKTHLRLTTDDEDGLISGLITAARLYAENYQNRIYVSADPNIICEEMPFLERAACLMLIAHWFENRSAMSDSWKTSGEIPHGVRDILALRRNTSL